MKMHEDEMQLRMDLLVDAELPEEERRELLLALDREPGKWRDLSIRFLERQVEKQGARAWIAGEEKGKDAARGDAATRRGGGAYKFPAMFGARVGGAIAAGLLVAAVSAVVTMYVAGRRGENKAVHDASPAVASLEPLRIQVPGQALETQGPVAVNVPMVNMQRGAGDQSWFPASSEERARAGSRRSVVIQADGAGNAVVIPVSTLPMKFY